MRIVFFGTPAFAVPSLRRLADHPAVEIPLVVTQPDRPAGRGRATQRSPVGIAADALGAPTYQPASLRDPASRAPLDIGADLFVVAAFGLIFGPKTLALPRLGCLNLHASLLPRFRGASPIAAAILAGDAVTGVTLMRMEVGLDTGPMLASTPESLRDDDTTETLADRLAVLGADLLPALLPDAAACIALAAPQPGRGASLTRPLAKADGWLDWRRSAGELERHVRAMWPWPRAWTTVGDAPVQVHRASVVWESSGSPPGRVVAADSTLSVACGEGALRLDVVQPASGRPMAGAVFAAGRGVSPTTAFGRSGAPEPRPPLVTPL